MQHARAYQDMPADRGWFENGALPLSVGGVRLTSMIKQPVSCLLSMRSRVWRVWRVRRAYLGV